MNSFSLYTDLYQLTMAQGYCLSEMKNTQASFSMYFRNLPFDGGFAIFCGSETLLDMLDEFSYGEEEIHYLSNLKTPSEDKLFNHDFLEELKNLKFELEISAPKEGTLVFPYEPIVRVTGPIWQCQLIETPLLNCINFQTLAATKAKRIVLSAKGRSISEFGLRRAQGLGSLWSARASYIAGFDSTSNCLASEMYKIPASGTHAHSWVMSFESELEAFRKYVEIYPTNAILLIDTYSVEHGLKNAIMVAKEMEARGEKLSGVRIDSGDLTWQSRFVRSELDAAGLSYVKIILSNNLDEYTISSIIDEGACVDGFGIGTKFACCYDDPTLGGVYKLNAIKNDTSGDWIGKCKISESAEKTTVPGLLNVKRFFDGNGHLAGDMVYDENLGVCTDEIVDPLNSLKKKSFGDLRGEKLLSLIYLNGKRTVNCTLEETRAFCANQLSLVDYTHKRNLNPHIYPVGIEKKLCKKRYEMIENSIRRKRVNNFD